MYSKERLYANHNSTFETRPFKKQNFRNLSLWRKLRNAEAEMKETPKDYRRAEEKNVAKDFKHSPQHTSFDFLEILWPLSRVFNAGQREQNAELNSGSNPPRRLKSQLVWIPPERGEIFTKKRKTRKKSLKEFLQFLIFLILLLHYECCYFCILIVIDGTL